MLSEEQKLCASMCSSGLLKGAMSKLLSMSDAIAQFVPDDVVRDGLSDGADDPVWRRGTRSSARRTRADADRPISDILFDQMIGAGCGRGDRGMGGQRDDGLGL